MNGIQQLTWQQLENAYPPFDFSFKTTDDLKCLDKLIGQERGRKAIEFGLSVEAEGYNIYISGEPGTGKTTLAKYYAHKVANQKPVPSDWCYVYNFREKKVPKALRFDSGDGRRFRNDMIELIEYLTNEIPYIYTDAKYQKQKNCLLDQCNKEKDLHLKKMQMQQMKDLEYQMGLENIGYYIKNLTEKYANYDKVISYLYDLQQDILDHVDVFINDGKGIDNLVSKYGVNLLVDHSDSSGAPVVIGSSPSYDKLLGTNSADYLAIKPGLLHQANGGYLILEAEDVLGNSKIWHLIKRLIKTKKLSPQIPLAVKLILVGSPDLYDERYFKVRVDFESEMCSTQANIKQVARFIKTLCDDQLLLSFSPGGVSEVIRCAIRYVGNKNKMTTKFGWIGDLVLESSTFATLEGANIVEEKHVQQAMAEKRWRAGLNQEKTKIHIAGEKIGQVNGFVLEDLVAVTATTYKGQSGLINIKQGSQMIGGYLGQTYGQEFSVSLTCQVCPDQSCGQIEARNASAELYSVLSSLSGVPLRQDIGVIGFVNQHGELQPVHQVTQKVEQFFELCKKTGLTGQQGVIIPTLNRDDLLLNDGLISAIKDKTFSIYTASTIEEGLVVLTGRPYEIIKEKVSLKLQRFNET